MGSSCMSKLRRRGTETLPSSQHREGDASLVDVEAGVGALLEPPESKSTWQEGSRMDGVNICKYEVLPINLLMSLCWVELMLPILLACAHVLSSRWLAVDWGFLLTALLLLLLTKIWICELDQYICRFCKMAFLCHSYHISNHIMISCWREHCCVKFNNWHSNLLNPFLKG